MKELDYTIFLRATKVYVKSHTMSLLPETELICFRY